MSDEPTNIESLTQSNDAVLQQLQQIRHVALDLDGTIYLGDTLFEFVHGFLDTLRSMNIGYTFLTNNSSRNTSQYVEHLRAMGIQSDPSMIYSSTKATVEYLRLAYPEVRKLYVLGTHGLHEEMLLAGYTICPHAPELVVVGFDTSLRYERLTQAAYWISQGLPFIATHPDLVCPTNEPLVLPDCGAICQLLTAATGREPDAVLGKPNPAILEGVLRRHGLTASEVAMVGDRLYTDIRMGKDAGMLSVLVLTGETDRTAVAESPIVPDLVIEHAGRLAELLQQAKAVQGVR